MVEDKAHPLGISRYLDAGINPLVATLELAPLAQKLRHSEEGPCWDEATFGRADMEYRRFLTMKRLEPQAELVPSKLMDEMWHAHILDTRRYIRDCQLLFGQYLHHFPYLGIGGQEAVEALDRRFEDTKARYRRLFGQELDAGCTARCEGHACHAPSSCACRTPGACK